MNIDELEVRLDNEFQKIFKSILINGEWGIGKTYFLENTFLKGKKYIEISLFGIHNMEEFNKMLYLQLNNKLSKLKENFNKYISGQNLNLFNIASITIPCIKTNIEQEIIEKAEAGNLIIVIDDLERKSSCIPMEDIMGSIESISKIKNMSIIIIGNIERMQKEDKKVFKNFKEKIIEKTYNIDGYSKIAIEEVIKIGINNIDVSEERQKIIKDAIIETNKKNKVENLRTVEKTFKFIQLVINQIDIGKLTEKEFFELISLMIVVVIEESEEEYIKENKDVEDKNINSMQIINAEEKNSRNKIINKILIKSVRKTEINLHQRSLTGYLVDIYNDINILRKF